MTIAHIKVVASLRVLRKSNESPRQAAFRASTLQKVHTKWLTKNRDFCSWIARANTHFYDMRYTLSWCAKTSMLFYECNTVNLTVS